MVQACSTSRPRRSPLDAAHYAASRRTTKPGAVSRRAASRPGRAIQATGTRDVRHASKLNAVWAFVPPDEAVRLTGSYRRVAKASGLRVDVGRAQPNRTADVRGHTEPQRAPDAVDLTGLPDRDRTRSAVRHGIFLQGSLDIGPSLSLDPTGRYVLLSDWQDSTAPDRGSIRSRDRPGHRQDLHDPRHSRRPRDQRRLVAALSAGTPGSSPPTAAVPRPPSAARSRRRPHRSCRTSDGSGRRDAGSRSRAGWCSSGEAGSAGSVAYTSRPAPLT